MTSVSLYSELRMIKMRPGRVLGSSSRPDKYLNMQSLKYTEEEAALNYSNEIQRVRRGAGNFC